MFLNKMKISAKINNNSFWKSSNILNKLKKIQNVATVTYTCTKNIRRCTMS